MQAFLIRQAPAWVVQDRRLVWNTIDIVESLGGEAVLGEARVFLEPRAAAVIWTGD